MNSAVARAGAASCILASDDPRGLGASEEAQEKEPSKLHLEMIVVYLLSKTLVRSKGSGRGGEMRFNQLVGRRS